jgi:hypothetical protein
MMIESEVHPVQQTIGDYLLRRLEEAGSRHAHYASSARLARHENSLADRARYLRDRTLDVAALISHALTT